MDFFYKPRPGVLGDCIPFYDNGRYHVFYLREFRDRDSYGLGAPWHHVSTTDFVRFADHGEALPRGRHDEQDHTTGTGCVFTDPTGSHHLFYTGINPYFRTASQHEQGLMRATSDDLITWTKLEEEVRFPDDGRFERYDWRDPFVFTHPETGRYGMLVAARLVDGPVTRRGCTAVMWSDDLTTWSPAEPFYAPARFHGHECPDWFRMGDWFYLVFSEYTTRTATRYVMSRSPNGPWISPVHDQFDNRAFYAAKTASDGERRFLFGWNPTKSGDRTDGDYQWGGCLTVHEVVQRDDGTLTVRMPSDAAAAFGDPRPVRFDDGLPLRLDAPLGYRMGVGDRLPGTCMLAGEITFAGLTGEAGILLGLDEAGDRGYFLRFDPVRQQLAFGKVGGHRHWYVDHMPELDRPLGIRAGDALEFRVVIDGTAVVAYVADRVALSARMYGGPFRRCGAYADGGSATLNRLVVHSLRGR
jgi:beta-fructofuranosidase